MNSGVAFPIRLQHVAVGVVSLVLVLSFSQWPGLAATGDALPFAKGFLLTGNYVVGGVDLTEQAHPPDQNGFSTGVIDISGVPVDADIVGAYLYWETITLTADLAQASGVRFRGEEILLNDVMGVKKNAAPLGGSTASCWSSGVPLTMTLFRADVLRHLPIRLDAENKPTGKRVVNTADLAAHGLAPHTVTLPVRNGNQVPESAGASLVLVYRDASEPLRRIVLYDGLHIQPSTQTAMTQSLQGFYRSSSVKSAKITHILASGQPNMNERVSFNDGAPAVISPQNPVVGGTASQRGWSNLTYVVSNLMNPGNASGPFGETATTTVDHTGGGGYDCLTWGAIIFAPAVADVDADGLPDGIEDSVSGLSDPPTSLTELSGQPLPNLNAMGANSLQKDIFFELNALWAPAGTSYGSASAPYNSTIDTLTDPIGHNHLPTPEVLKAVGDAFAARGIRAHFDVGNVASYHAPNIPYDPRKFGVVAHTDWVDDYTSTVADDYLVPSGFARGGEVVQEQSCNPSNPACQFPAFPGTVSWKFGLQIHRDAPVADDGAELEGSDYADWIAGTQRRRFDPNRKGLFHYVFYAHARGKPKSDDENHPDFHVPLSASGVADLPGGNVMITLGLWDEFVGRPFVRASTTFHEIGHNLNLWHGGLDAKWGNKAPLSSAPTGTVIEPNCKPNYLSSMSYLFQVHGLFDDNDNIHLDYSAAAYSNLNETTALADLTLAPGSPYRPAWFTPATSLLATSLGVPAATRFCNGLKFDTTTPPPMARVYATTAAAPIDWNGDLVTNEAGTNQDVNFDAALSATLSGFDDWNNIALNQVGAGRNGVKFQDGDFIDFGSGDFIDFGSGDFLDFGSGDFIDFGSGDFLDFGSGVFLDSQSGDFLDFGSGDFIDFGSGDFIDFGSGDFLDFASGSERQELDYDAARGLGRSAPYALKACVVGQDAGCTVVPPSTPHYHRNEIRWQTPTVGQVASYQIQRKRGNVTSAFSFVQVGTSTIPSFIDPEELPNGVQFTYRVRATFNDDATTTASPFSTPVTVTAVNNPPVANADGYSTVMNATLNVAARGVLTNDTDVDSAPASLRAVLVAGPSSGTLTLNASGAFVYAPRNGFTGTDTFTYKANNGVWNVDPTVPMSADSKPVSVTITVQRRGR